MCTSKIIFILYVISCYFQAYGADKYTDENRPYEFGFTIEGEQHRHEKKDENGIIMGEFGFITADGVYHVTVYATDENGNFKILSMKNIRVKPYPTAPGVSTKQTPVTSNQQSQPFNKLGTIERVVPSIGVRQGHSIPLSASQEVSPKPSSDETPQIKLQNNEPARSCSHCSVPTTTTAVPKLMTIKNQQFSQSNFAQSEPVINPYAKNQFNTQQPKQNYPSLESVFTQQVDSNPDKSEANLSIYENQNSITKQFNQVNRASTSNEEQQYQQTYFQNTAREQSYQQNLNPGQENAQNINQSLTFSVGNSKVQNSQNGKTYPQEYTVQNNKDNKAPGIPRNHLEIPNSEPPYSLNSQTNVNIPENNDEGQNFAQEPQSNIDGYQHPKSFNDILQSANPDQFSNTNDAGFKKPVLIAAQMELVKKDAPDIAPNHLETPNSEPPYSLNSQKNDNVPKNNNGGQNFAQQPQSNIDGYPHPKSFNHILQSANPDQFSYTNEAGFKKPVLIAAQMELVNKDAPGIVLNHLEIPNSEPPYSSNSQRKVNVPENNNGDQNFAQQPQSNIDGYRHPKSFNDILQSANPDQFSNTNEAGFKKPVLIAAQMELVDKNTDIYHKQPGEKDGLPKGLNINDMTQLLYTFNYTVGFYGHHEEGYCSGAKVGYYFVTSRNGIRTRVDYVADDNGFRPKITQEVLDILSEEVPKPETEKDEKYGLKGYEFKWLYYPVESKRR